MIIFADEKLNVKKVVHETVHQGSNKANTIQFVAPINSNATVKIAFSLPNGTTSRLYVLESIGNYDEYYMWSVDVPFAITQNPGKVIAQVIASIGAVDIGSSKVEFIVSEGVEYENEDIDENQYSEIMAYINEAKVGVANKVSINYNKMTLVESPQSTYSSDCYKATYSYSVVRGNIENTAGYYVYNYNEETGVGSYTEATGNVDSQTTYYSKVISGYEKVTLPDDYVEGTNYYTIDKQQSIFNDNNGLYFYVIENGKTKTMRILGDKITIDDKEVITEDKMNARNMNYDDTSTTLGATTIQEAIEKVDQKVDAIDVSEVIQFVNLGMFSIEVSSWSAVQYFYVLTHLTSADNNEYYVFNSETNEYDAVTVTSENFDATTNYFKREEYYYYDFTHRLLTNSITQDLMLTPDDLTNALLDNENIKIYPNVEMGGTTGSAFGRIKISKIPSRTITFVSVTLFGTGIANEARGIKASQIDFDATDTLEATSVQGAIEELEENIDDRLDDVEEDVTTLQTTVAQLQSSKTRDAYIVANASAYSSTWLQDAENNIFNTEDGTLNQYDNYYIQTDGDYKGNTYTWSGTNFVKVAGNLTLGTSSAQAYPGNEGAYNRTKVANHDTQLSNLAQRITTAEGDIETIEGSLSPISQISGIQSTIGNDTLLTTSQTLKGAINELNGNLNANKVTFETLKVKLWVSKSNAPSSAGGGGPANAVDLFRDAPTAFDMGSVILANADGSNKKIVLASTVEQVRVGSPRYDYKYLFLAFTNYSGAVPKLIRLTNCNYNRGTTPAMADNVGSTTIDGVTYYIYHLFDETQDFCNGNYVAVEFLIGG